MAISDNTKRKQKDTDRGEVSLATTVNAYGGSILYRDAAGRGVAAPVTAQPCAGVVVTQADNSAGANDDVVAEVYEEGCFEFTFSNAITAADIGKVVYGVDNDTVDDADPGEGCVIGYLVKVTSGTTGFVRLELFN